MPDDRAFDPHLSVGPLSPSPGCKFRSVTGLAMPLSSKPESEPACRQSAATETRCRKAYKCILSLMLWVQGGAFESSSSQATGSGAARRRVPPRQAFVSCRRCGAATQRAHRSWRVPVTRTHVRCPQNHGPVLSALPICHERLGKSGAGDSLTWKLGLARLPVTVLPDGAWAPQLQEDT